ncbi:glycoside hydrolase family 88/105 protein [Alteromonas sp. 76-1]|jgi:unsaturated rhamnogalacturonyl hydrolase|uniref:glycoside hydrolase family 88/105 protein n=1 Tax=Alteromonas sp. 76-1 TaxID=2358187 RepID=UPI00101B5E7D|nr:glycoside hydrolase family 88 protein [Alteromonas sp. 76-1]
MMKTHIRKISRYIGIKIGLFAMAYIPLTSLQAEAVLPTQEHVMAQMEKVANWQVARTQHMTHVGRARAGSEAYGRWIQGAFYKGLTKLAERSDNPFYETWIGYVGDAHDWKMGKVKYFADDHVIGQTNLWYYRRHKNEEALAPVKETFDWLIEQAPDNSLEFVAGRNKDNVHNCQWRWCWADALFMGPPVLFELSVITGESKYADYAHKEFQATIDYLQDPKTKLIFRDSRYFDKKGKFGEQVFWSRGMGWVYAGVVHALESLPQDHQYRPYYESLYQELTSAIVKLQKQDGAWPMSLLAGERYVEPETSGTAFFTYGVTWGINNDLLDESTYLPSALKGWQVLSSAVHPDGKFGWVQGVNEKPDVVTKDDSQLFGVGAFLLAGSAMYDFVDSQ